VVEIVPDTVGMYESARGRSIQDQSSRRAQATKAQYVMRSSVSSAQGRVANLNKQGTGRRPLQDQQTQHNTTVMDNAHPQSLPWHDPTIRVIKCGAATPVFSARRHDKPVNAYVCMFVVGKGGGEGRRVGGDIPVPGRHHYHHHHRSRTADQDENRRLAEKGKKKLTNVLIPDLRFPSLTT
jgi:hypothetical protein